MLYPTRRQTEPRPGRRYRFFSACSATVRSAVGTASSRSSGIGSPLSTERPYVPRLEPGLRPLERVELVGEILGEARVELVLVEVLRPILGGVSRRVRRLPQAGEGTLDSLSLASEQEACTFRVHPRYSTPLPPRTQPRYRRGTSTAVPDRLVPRAPPIRFTLPGDDALPGGHLGRRGARPDRARPPRLVAGQPDRRRRARGLPDREDHRRRRPRGVHHPGRRPRLRVRLGCGAGARTRATTSAPSSTSTSPTRTEPQPSASPAGKSTVGTSASAGSLCSATTSRIVEMSEAIGTDSTT